MAKVFFARVTSYSDTEKVNAAARKVLDALAKENLEAKFEGALPVKVHFGEKGNNRFIEPKNFESTIKWLQEKNPKARLFFADTNSLYKGARTFKADHEEIAREHGFTSLPVIISDGDHGEEFIEVELPKKEGEGTKHFKKFLIGKELAEKEGMIVLAHFKGHIIAGFGGAIKQLAMGCASRGGKMAQHSNSKVFIEERLCKKCKLCVQSCPADAIFIGEKSIIDPLKCIGCATCLAVCPTGAVKREPSKGGEKDFLERLAEYALAATFTPKGKKKKILYINFALNIAKYCDCMDSKQKLVAKDVGVLASTDPVAIDQACLDLLEKQKHRKIFGGYHAVEYAEKIGLGSRVYDLIEIK